MQTHTDGLMDSKSEFMSGNPGSFRGNGEYELI